MTDSVPHDLPRIVVVYDRGAASPWQILRAARGVCAITFGVPVDGSSHVERLKPMLSRLSHIAFDPKSPDGAGVSIRSIAPDAITTFSQRRIADTHALSAQAGLPHVEPRDLFVLSDKYAQRHAFAECGVVAPVRCRALQIADGGQAVQDAVVRQIMDFGLPAVLKPRQGVGSHGVRRLETEKDAAMAVHEATAPTRPRQYLLEEMLQGDPSLAGPGWGDYVSVETFVVNGEPSHLGVTGKLPLLVPFREQGMVFPSTLSDRLMRECVDVAAAAIASLPIVTGAVHTELKLTALGPRIIEVNTRLGGYLSPMYEAVTGVDPIRLVLRNALGIAAPSIPEPEGVGLQLLIMPPLDALRFDKVENLDLARQLSEVVDVSLLIEPGSTLNPLDGEVASAVNVYGQTKDHESALDLSQRLRDLIRITWA